MFTPQSETKFGMSKVTSDQTKYPFEPCKLYDFGGDVNKRWSIAYYIYNRDQNKLVRRRISGFNRIKSARTRKAAARELMQQIDDLLRQRYTEGGQEALSDSLAFLQESEADFNLSTFTLRQAVIYFINYKNAATLKNKADRMEENYREGLARIKKNTFDTYKTFLNLQQEFPARYQFVREPRHQPTVRRLCQAMEVSMSGYYAWLKQPENLTYKCEK